MDQLNGQTLISMIVQLTCTYYTFILMLLQVLEKIFRVFDVNSDGVITGNEMSTIVKVRTVIKLSLDIS